MVSLCLVLGIPAVSYALCDVSLSTLNFGGYDTLTNSPSDSVGTISYFCSQSVPMLTIAIDRGRGGAGPVRQLGKAGGAGNSILSYNIYLDPGRSRVWGDGTQGSQVLSIPNPAVGRRIDIPVYGHIAGGQNVAAGSYNDSLSVTISY